MKLATRSNIETPAWPGEASFLDSMASDYDLDLREDTRNPENPQ